jgi:signal transduction histidine kinase
MTAKKLNCWEDKRCGCEPGGAAAQERGVCPAATDTTCDGINGGRNAGRFCWVIGGTLCDGEVQGSLEEKTERCQRCSFFRRVKYEEGGHLQLLKPGLCATEVGELHRLLNNVVKVVGVSRDILACLAEGPLLDRITEHARDITGSSSVSAYLIDGSGEQLVLEAHAGRLDRPRRVRLDGDSPVAEAARRRLCVGPLALAGRAEPAFVAAVPMGGREGLPGVLELIKTARGFSPDDEWFLRECGLIAGLGIENARHVEDLRQLRRFDKAKSRFVALLMHHIASPLATIACSLEALAKLAETLTDQDRRELIDNSLDRINSIQSLSRRLLDLAAIRSGRSLRNARPVRLRDCLREEVQARQAKAQEKGLEIVVTESGPDTPVLADPDGLRLVLGNLIGNAIKYSTNSSKSVDIDVTTSGDAVHVRVRDRGIGVPPEEQAKIFEEFHRGSNVTAAHASGFGIGLAVVKELVDRYEGQIKLESEVGVGTTVFLELPAWQG